MTQEEFASLIAVVHYLATDEEKHWKEAGEPTNHIYCDVVRLQNWIANNEPLNE